MQSQWNESALATNPGTSFNQIIFNTSSYYLLPLKAYKGTK